MLSLWLKGGINRVTVLFVYFSEWEDNEQDNATNSNESRVVSAERE